MQNAPGAAAGPHVRTSLSSSKAYTLDQWVSDFLSRCAFATIPAKRCDTLIDQSTTTHILEVEHTTEAELPENDFVKKEVPFLFENPIWHLPHKYEAERVQLSKLDNLALLDGFIY
jgi:hypothetical protein